MMDRVKFSYVFNQAVGCQYRSLGQVGGLQIQRTLDPSSSPSAILSASNVLRWLASPHRSPITTGFACKPPHCGTPAGSRNSLPRPVCLHTSRLREFSTELVSD